VHRRSEIRAKGADGAGEWVIDYEIPEPEPAPVTTIAWRSVHVAAVNYLYWDYAFGPASLSFDLPIPNCAAHAIAWLSDSQRPLREALVPLDDHDLNALRLHNSGERLPTVRLFEILIREQVHYGGEISLMRDLYRNRSTLGR
jgi:DinB superfamily